MRGQAKILDFGLAKLAPQKQPGMESTAGATQDVAALSTPGVAMGTIAYMSPEQARGREVDARTDIFSFGVVLYEMTTGRPAFPGSTTAEVFEALLTRAPVAPVRLNSNVPVELEHIINKALEKDAKLRYQSAADLRSDLERLKRDMQLASASRQAVAAPIEPPAGAQSSMGAASSAPTSAAVAGSDARRAAASSAPTSAAVAGSDALRGAAAETPAVAGEGRLKPAPTIAVNRRWLALAGAAAALAVVLAAGAYFYFHRAPGLTEKDTIVLADFTNTTGDAVFDGTLRQGLAAQLEQSPFLNILSDQQTQQTLRLMGQPPEARLTPQIARELCQRTQSAAVLDGSIASLGSQYVLGLRAVNCRTGDSLAQEQATADGKEHVLKALGEVAAKLRAKLGESLSTVQKFDTPVEQATTPSLEALQAYSLGRKTMVGKGDFAAAVPLFQRAIHLDPNFAMAYASLGVDYSNLGENSLAVESTRKAYELRERVSEREKFYIESHYYELVPGDLEKARQAYELWAQTYPRDDVPPDNLGSIYIFLGQYDRALGEGRETLRLSPDGVSYSNLVQSYLYLNRLEEARATAQEAQAKKLDSPPLRFFLYQLAFLQNDAAGMAQQVAWSAGKPGVEDLLLASEADTAAYSGRLGKAREFSRRAVASAERAEQKETAAGYEADAALREALFGNAAEGRQRAAAALGLSTGRDVQYGVALALAVAGDAARAQALADDLAKRFPEDTIVKFNYVPTLRAQLAFGHSDPSKAIEALQAAAPYELGAPGVILNFVSLCPVYVRGEAYLAGNRGSEAAAEFQKILDHPGVVVNEPIGALAHLGLARAYVLEGDVAKARTAYQDFFALWKDADADIPILVAAKAEYAKLK